MISTKRGITRDDCSDPGRLEWDSEIYHLYGSTDSPDQPYERADERFSLTITLVSVLPFVNEHPSKWRG